MLVDARPADMYSGKTIRHSVQGGHIPGALNVVSLDGTDPLTQKWRDETELAGALPGCFQGQDRIPLLSRWLSDEPWLVTAPCHGLPGYPSAGWRLGVWDRAFTLPVVTGDQPYDEEFAL